MESQCSEMVLVALGSISLGKNDIIKIAVTPCNDNLLKSCGCSEKNHFFMVSTQKCKSA